MADVTINLDAARASLAQLTPRLAELAPERIRGVRLRRLCLRLVGFLAELRVDPRFPRLQGLDGVDGWSIGCMDRLDAAAQALWVILTDVDSATLESTLLLDADLVDRATTRRAEMIRVVTYFGHGDERIATEIADIRRGTGHEDLAVDLERLAKLYHQLAPQLGEGALGFTLDDATGAIADANTILSTIAAHRALNADTLREQSSRLQALIRIDWDALVAAGRFVFRDDGPEARFPSLRTLAS